MQVYDIDTHNLRDEWGYTLAHWAALYGHVAVIQFLIRHNIPTDLYCFGTQGPKPIHWASRQGHTSIIAVLLHVSSVHIYVSINFTKFH